MKCLHELFSLQAALTPGELAVVDGARSLSYEELDQESSRLAGLLQSCEIGPDDTVGLFLEKSVDYIVACLATLKAGGAFLPLFLDYPETLLSKILEQTRSKVVLSSSEISPRLPASAKTKLVLMDSAESRPSYDLKPPELSPENLMFVVYTSGTTGEPKGIQLPHRAAVHSYQERYKISSYAPGQRVACNIFFVWEFFRPLLKGATVYVISDDIIYDPKLLSRFLQNNLISEVLFTPSLMETMLNHLEAGAWRERLSSLQVIWLNGEVVTEKMRSKALRVLPPTVGLFNTYSISECHDVASLDLRTAEVSPTGFCRVGYPIEGISVHLLDQDGQPSPSDRPGELHVGGPGLARGYLGKPHLTAERFVNYGGQKLYRTGDLVYQYEDGLLEVRGRCDGMVKIRGYSVHLGAVQAALEKIDSVQSAAVIAVGEEGRDKRLVAYVLGTPQRDWQIDPQTSACPVLREKLRDHLAEFMLPNLFVELSELPLSSTTGKLDAKRLPPPPIRASYGLEELEPYSSPMSYQDKESLMATLWERLLGLDPGVVTRESNFFDLGGHSLMAVRLVQHIERIFACPVTVKQLYEYPTVKQLTNFLEQGHQSSLDSQSGPRPEDWTLDSSIVFSQKNKPVKLSEARAIFLTGGTGFLGAFLLHRLLSLTQVPIYCLVRSHEMPAHARLEANLESYGLGRSPMLRAVAGDLSLDKLGLSADDYQTVSQEVDLVFHCGAAVNYVHSYEALKPHTVKGTEEILRFCSVGKPKTLHYISTNGIFPGGDTYLENNQIAPFLAELGNGYGQSKWVAENLLWQAIDRGLSATLFRPGNIGHHSVSGVANPNDFQTLIIRACLAIEAAPDVEHWNFELTPVDFFAQVLTEFADCTEHAGQVFNVVQQPTTPARPFFERLLKEQHIHRLLRLDVWLEELHRRARELGDSKLEVLANSLSDVEGYLSDSSRYDNQKFREALRKHKLEIPKADGDYLELLVRATSAQSTLR